VPSDGVSAAARVAAPAGGARSETVAPLKVAAG
jgi:hypothetical protein